jgi:hypothetical protein
MKSVGEATEKIIRLTGLNKEEIKNCKIAFLGTQILRLNGWI